MSLLRSLVRAALRCLDNGQSEKGQGSAPLMLPPPRSEVGFPHAQQVYGQPMPQGHSLQRMPYAPPPIAWQPPPSAPIAPQPPAPRRRRRKTVTVTEEIFYRRG